MNMDTLRITNISFCVIMNGTRGSSAAAAEAAAGTECLAPAAPAAADAAHAAAATAAAPSSRRGTAGATIGESFPALNIAADPCISVLDVL